MRFLLIAFIFYCNKRLIITANERGCWMLQFNQCSIRPLVDAVVAITCQSSRTPAADVHQFDIRYLDNLAKTSLPC